MHIYFNNHDMEILTAHIVAIYITIQTKYILLDMATLGVNNKLETFWKGFASGTNVLLENFGHLDQPFQITLKVLPRGLNQLLGFKNFVVVLAQVDFNFSSLLIPLKGLPD